MAIIGIDIGGTKIRGVLWDSERVLRAREFPTPTSQREFKIRLVELSSWLVRPNSIQGIGIGAAGIVEGKKLLVSPNLPCIRHFDFRSLWPRSIRLRVDNDARCFARAEFLRGAGVGAKKMFALTLGTGVGRAWGKNSKIVKLKGFESPEPWEKEYQTARDTDDDRRLASFLASKLASLIEPFEPEVIVIGGGVLERRNFLRRLRAALDSWGFIGKVRHSRLSRNAVAVGAALLFD